MGYILKTSGLTKSFGNLKAVDNLSFEIEKGQVYGILGPNGSGKSTTLGMILNVVNKTQGQVQWFDGKLTTQQALKKTGAIIERPNFYPYLTAKQNLELVCKIKEIPTDTIYEKLELVNLLERKDHKFKTFSLGMKQRLAIASSLLNKPELLILDEPTNGLDPEGIHKIRDLIKKISTKGTTIILASHLLDEVEKVCTKVIVLQKGKKIFDGDVKNINNNSQWFEIEVDDIDKTKEVLETNPNIDKITVKNNKIKLFTKILDGKQINKFLVNHDIYVHSINKKQTSLEDQFLKITNEQ